MKLRSSSSVLISNRPRRCASGAYMYSVSPAILYCFVGSHGAECAHIVQSVGHFYQHHAYILAHGQQQLAEILSLSRCSVAENTARNFGEALHQLGYLRPEMALDILYRVVGIFHHIMKQRSTNRRRAKSDLLRGYLGHGYRMKYVWLARTPSYTLMSLFLQTDRRDILSPPLR